MSDRSGIRLLPEEKVLLEANDGILTLTTHRVRLDQRGSGHSRLVGITLDAVASCGLVTKSAPILLVLGAIAGALGLALLSQRSEAPGLLLTAVGVALVIAYVVSRSSVLAVASAGETISVAIKGMNRDSIAEFVETLEQAKLARPRR